MEDLQAILATDLTTLDDERAADRIGELIDLAADFGDEKTRQGSVARTAEPRNPQR